MIKYLRYPQIVLIHSIPILTNMNPNKNKYKHPNYLIISSIMVFEIHQYQVHPTLETRINHSALYVNIFRFSAVRINIIIYQIFLYTLCICKFSLINAFLTLYDNSLIPQNNTGASRLVGWLGFEHDGIFDGWDPYMILETVYELTVNDFH